MTHSMLSPRIMVPLDGSHVSERVLPHAAELAHAVGGSLILVHMAHALPGLRLGFSHLLPQDPHSYLSAHAEVLRGRGLVVETMLVAADTPAALIAEIERDRPNLVAISVSCQSWVDDLAQRLSARENGVCVTELASDPRVGITVIVLNELAGRQVAIEGTWADERHVAERA